MSGRRVVQPSEGHSRCCQATSQKREDDHDVDIDHVRDLSWCGDVVGLPERAVPPVHIAAAARFIAGATDEHCTQINVGRCVLRTDVLRRTGSRAVIGVDPKSVR